MRKLFLAKYGANIFLLFTFLIGFTAFANVPAADANACVLADTVYVDPAAGIDRSGCWGYDKTHAYKTAQAAINYKNSLYTGTETSFPILRYKPNTGTEPINNAGGVPFVIMPYSGFPMATMTFSVQGQNLEFNGFNFISGGIKIAGTSDFMRVISNTFGPLSGLGITGNSDVYVSRNTFNSTYIDDRYNLGSVNIWTNTFAGTAPSVGNYGKIFVLAESQTGAFDFVGNNVTGGQALYVKNSSNVVVMNNTIVGGGLVTETAVSLYGTGANSLERNTISLVGNGIVVDGGTVVKNVNFVNGNNISLVDNSITQTKGISLSNVSTNEIKNNVISGGDEAVEIVKGVVPLVNGNTLSSGSIDFFASESDVGNITNNSFASTGKGIYIVLNSTVDTIEKNNFGASVAGIVIDSKYGNFDAWRTEKVSGDKPAPMNAGTNISNNTFSGTDIGIGLATAEINDVSGNTFRLVDDGIMGFYSTINQVTGNKFTASGVASSIGVYLYNSSISEMTQNVFDAFNKGLEMVSKSVIFAKMDGNIFKGGAYGITISDSQFGAPLVNQVFANNQTGINVTAGSGTGFEILFSTFYGQTAKPIYIGTLASGTMTIANNVFSSATASVYTDRVADISELNYNLYNVFAAGGAIVQVAGVPYTLAALQGINFETNAYEETGPMLRNPAAGDFGLKFNSLGINSADSSYGINHDVNNKTRPVCVAPDRGAYEASPAGIADSDKDGLCNFQETAWSTSDSNPDSDGDTINDYAEIYVLRSNPIRTDTDKDGIDDGFEYTHTCLNILVNDATTDSDGDTLLNGDEYSAGMNPCSTDSDEDGMDDKWETTYGLDPTVDDTTGDLDNDGLINIDEYTLGTEPNNSDTDGDTFSDYEEFVFGTDPLDPNNFPNDGDHDNMDDDWEILYGLNPDDPSDAETDLDDDGLTNYEEYVLGTYPNNPDSDADGLSDGDEKNVYGTDPLNVDTDGDSYSDGDEVSVGSDPLNSASTPLTLDTDGDGLTDHDETTVYGTNPNNPDTDADGLNDYEEIIIYGTDANLSDTDSDGLNDYAEITNYQTDPTDSDSDDDGLFDGDEINVYGTNPNLSDTDNDTFTDGTEVLAGSDPLDPASTPNTTDSDNDGLADVVEIALGTDINDSDSDDDGLSDGDEVNNHGTNPLSTDSDGDGLNDYAEIITYLTNPNDTDSDNDNLSDYVEVTTYGTNPNLADTDGDTFSDSVEIAVGSDPLNSASTPNTLDTDGDGLTDVIEASLGTNPNDSDSDDDGLLDGEEVNTYGTDPLLVDTDGDTYSDSVEIVAGTDPLNINDHPVSNVDTDGDGLFDFEETIYGTSSTNPDTDLDGLTDYQEIRVYSTNPLVADSDGDTLNDYAEIITYGTDAEDVDSDGDLFRDDYEITEGSNALSAASTPSLTLSFAGFLILTGYGDASSWVTTVVFFNYSQDVEITAGAFKYVEFVYYQYGALGVSWNENEYLGSVLMTQCYGQYATEFNPTGYSCTAIPEYTASANPDLEATHVTDSSQLESWSTISPHHNFEDWDWYRPVVATDPSVLYYDSFKFTLAP